MLEPGLTVPRHSLLHGPPTSRRSATVLVDAGDKGTPVLVHSVLGGIVPVPARRGWYPLAPCPPLRAPLTFVPPSPCRATRSAHTPSPTPPLSLLISRLTQQSRAARAMSSVPCPFPQYAWPSKGTQTVFVPCRWHYDTPMLYPVPSWSTALPPVPSHCTWPWVTRTDGTAAGPKFISTTPALR